MHYFSKTSVYENKDLNIILRVLNIRILLLDQSENSSLYFSLSFTISNFFFPKLKHKDFEFTNISFKWLYE